MEPTPAAVTLKNRYFLCLRGEGPVEWHPGQWQDWMPRDCIYFGNAFLEMERHLASGGFHIYTTYDYRSLPEYGPHVIVLLLGEEIGRAPRYIRHVRAVFKTMRTRPFLGIRKWRFDKLRLSLLIKAVRDWVAHWQAVIDTRRIPPDWPAPVHSTARHLDVPLGYWNLDSLPQKTMAGRPYHCFFAGQINPPRGSGLKRFLPLPKDVARSAMQGVLQEMVASEPRFRFDGSTVNDMGAGSLGTYSQRMMDSKFCLAPRGNVVDTFRYFEGMRSGCVVVCEPLPEEWFYKDAPVLQLDDWEDLPKLIAPYLEDDDALDVLRVKTLSWWEEKCSETAVGRAMADFVNTFSPDPD